MNDTIKQEMEALKEIQEEADELAERLELAPCKSIDCDECPAKRFCHTYRFSWSLSRGEANE